MMERRDNLRPLRILLVDDHEIVRIGLRAVLERQADLAVVGEAASAADAVAQTMALRPDVVLMDIRLSGESGIDACAKITHDRPETRVSMLTSFADDELLVAAIAAGAAGYALKRMGSEELLEVIRTIGSGAAQVDPSMTNQLFKRIRRSLERERREAFDGLNDQELRILSLITQGKSNREIGQMLAISEKTARNYVSGILSKLQLTSRVEAAAYAVRHHVEDFLTDGVTDSLPPLTAS